MKKIFGSILLAVILNACAKPTNGCYTYSPTAITNGTVVGFDASCSEGAISYNWDFGDGTYFTSTSVFTTHVFNVPGSYNVKLTAERKDGVTIRKEDPTFVQTIVVH
jgi:PKD repeat protein